MNGTFEDAKSYKVYGRDNWSDPWVLIPYLRPTRMRCCTAPDMQTADFQWDFGSVKEADRTDFRSVQPFTGTTTGTYLKIVLLENNSETPMFYGVVVDDGILSDSPDEWSGTQTFRAYGMEWLLDRVDIANSAFQPSQSQPTIKFVRHVLPFNSKKEEDTTVRVRGNRTPQSNNSDNIHVFANDHEDAALWTGFDMVTYLLKYGAPTGIEMDMEGQTDALQIIKDTINPAGMTVWECLNRIIANRLGLGFRVRVGNDNKLWLKIFTANDQAIDVGSTTLPANPNAGPFTQPSIYPYQHVVEPVLIRRTINRKADSFLIRGERMRVTCNLSFADGSLAKGWRQSIQSDYQTAGNIQDPAKADTFRAQDRFKAVFNYFVVPGDFAGKIKDGQNSGPQIDIAYGSHPDGVPAAKGIWCNLHKRILRDTVMRDDKNYQSSTPTDIDTGRRPELLPITGYINKQPWQLRSNAAYTTGWMRIDNTNAESGIYPNMSVQPLTSGCGITFNMQHGHRATRDAEPETQRTNYPATLDYRTAIIVGTMETDFHAEIVLEAENPGAVTSTRVINVPDAHLWILETGTVIGLKEDGSLLRTTKRHITRDDTEMLRVVGAIALAIYGRDRQACSIPIHKLYMEQEQFDNLGDIVTEIQGAYHTFEINTVLTSVDVDFENQSVTYNTSFADLDFIGMIDAAGVMG